MIRTNQTGETGIPIGIHQFTSSLLEINKTGEYQFHQFTSSIGNIGVVNIEFIEHG